MCICTECGAKWEDSAACNSWGHCFKFGDCERHIDVEKSDRQVSFGETDK